MRSVASVGIASSRQGTSYVCYVRRSMCPSCDMHTCINYGLIAWWWSHASLDGSSCGRRAMRHLASMASHHLGKVRTTYVRRSMCPSCDMHTFIIYELVAWWWSYASCDGSSCEYRAMRHLASFRCHVTLASHVHIRRLQLGKKL